MKTSFISSNPETSNRAKVLALVSLAFLGTFAACYLVFNGNSSSQSTLLADNSTLLHDLYTQWKLNYNKTYATDEDTLRFTVFSNNYENILSHNAKNSSYKLGLNRFADLTREEFSSLHTIYKTDSKHLSRSRSTAELSSLETLPTSVDWVLEGAVTSVRDQGQCSANWAISAVGTLEGLYYLQTGNLYKFSVQQIIDCCTTGFGCAGGRIENAVDYVTDNGIELEVDYPYTANDGACVYDQFKTIQVSSNFNYVTPNSDSDLQIAVAQQPISAAVESYGYDFQFYVGGIIDSSSDCGTDIDLGVLIVGYGVDNGQGYWKVKNSWSATWGEDGYVRIARASGAGVCGINMQPLYAV